MPDSQPNTPDAQGTVDASGAGGTEANQASEAAKAAVELEKLSEALGRKVTSTDDALKAVKNLHSMVGDRTISDLRKKAEAHDTLEALVSGYAKQEGLKPEEARKQLEDLARDASPRRDERVDKVLEEMSSLKLQLQEKDFIADHPEAKSVLKELKALSQATGQSLSEAYESSALKNLAAKAAASEEREKIGTFARPSGRTVVPNEKAKAALERLREDRSGDAMDEYVKATVLSKR